VRFMSGSTEASKGSIVSGADLSPRPIYSRCGSRDIVRKRRTMLARQRYGGGHAERRFLGYSSKAPLVRRCIALGQTAGSGLRHYQPARGGAHRGCPESRDLRQRQLSAAAVWPPRSRLTAIGQHAGSPARFVESATAVHTWRVSFNEKGTGSGESAEPFRSPEDISAGGTV
jgi:hypothetical protein